MSAGTNVGVGAPGMGAPGMGPPGMGPPDPSILERRFPPVPHLVIASLMCVVVGGIFMASYVPRRPPLTGPIVLAVVGVLLLLGGVVLLVRIQDFAWDRFLLVFRWGLLAYAISAGMIGFAFLRDHTRGAPLAVVIVMLVIFAVDVPIVIAFTVARYASPSNLASTG
jgi:hypothetical protein